MATLHIEHDITDFTSWKAAFDRFADRRKEAGVTAHRIYQPHDDAAYVILQLDFPSVEQAQAFRTFLESRVWSTLEVDTQHGRYGEYKVLIDGEVVVDGGVLAALGVFPSVRKTVSTVRDRLAT